ncbi:hypothetical protein ABE099_12225 [Paenibacillus turicensis]
MKTSIIFKNGTDKDNEFLDSQLEQYNLTSKPLTQSTIWLPYVSFRYI